MADTLSTYLPPRNQAGVLRCSVRCIATSKSACRFPALRFARQVGARLWSSEGAWTPLAPSAFLRVDDKESLRTSDASRETSAIAPASGEGSMADVVATFGSE